MVCFSFQVFTPEQDGTVVVTGPESVTCSGFKIPVVSDFTVVIGSRKGYRTDGMDLKASRNILVLVVVFDINARTVVQTYNVINNVVPVLLKKAAVYGYSKVPSGSLASGKIIYTRKVTDNLGILHGFQCQWSVWIFKRKSQFKLTCLDVKHGTEFQSDVSINDLGGGCKVYLQPVIEPFDKIAFEIKSCPTDIKRVFVILVLVS